jgi:hypothetical protein
MTRTAISPRLATSTVRIGRNSACVVMAAMIAPFFVLKVTERILA